MNVLVLNRGEIAFRAIKVCQKLELTSYCFVSENELETKITQQADHFISVSRRFVLFVGLTVKRYQGDSKRTIPFYDQHPLGGAHSMRGYEEQQFRSPEVGWVNIENRYHLSRKSRAFIFLDAGQYKPDQWMSPLLGYGIGVRLKAGIGIIGLDYGLGEGDSLTDGKLHFGLQNDF